MSEVFIDLKTYFYISHFFGTCSLGPAVAYLLTAGEKQQNELVYTFKSHIVGFAEGRVNDIMSSLHKLAFQ